MSGVGIDPNLFLSNMVSNSHSPNRHMMDANFATDLNPSVSSIHHGDMLSTENISLRQGQNFNSNRGYTHASYGASSSSTLDFKGKLHPRSQASPLIGSKFFNSRSQSESLFDSGSASGVTTTVSNPFMGDLVDSSSRIGLTNSNTNMISGSASDINSGTSDIDSLMNLSFQSSRNSISNPISWGQSSVGSKNNKNVQFGRLNSIWNDSPKFEETPHDSQFFSPFHSIDTSYSETDLSLSSPMVFKGSQTIIPNYTYEEQNGFDRMQEQQNQFHSKSHLQNQSNLPFQTNLYVQHSLCENYNQQFLPAQPRHHTNFYQSKVSNVQSFVPKNFKNEDHTNLETNSKLAVTTKASLVISTALTSHSITKVMKEVLQHAKVSKHTISTISTKNVLPIQTAASLKDSKIVVNLPRKRLNYEIKQIFNDCILSEKNMKKAYHEDYCSTFYKRNIHGYMFVKEPATSLKVNSNGVGSKLWVQLKINLPRAENSMKKLKIDVRELPYWWPATATSSKPKRSRKKDCSISDKHQFDNTTKNRKKSPHINRYSKNTT